jgi:hypothetical protein
MFLTAEHFPEWLWNILQSNSGTFFPEYYVILGEQFPELL